MGTCSRAFLPALCPAHTSTSRHSAGILGRAPKLALKKAGVGEKGVGRLGAGLQVGAAGMHGGSCPSPSRSRAEQGSIPPPPRHRRSLLRAQHRIPTKTPSARTDKIPAHPPSSPTPRTAVLAHSTSLCPCHSSVRAQMQAAGERRLCCSGFGSGFDPDEFSRRPG